MLLIDKLRGHQDMTAAAAANSALANFVAPLVGAHYRPPAKALLEVLRAGTQLRLVPEPDNPFDPNAIKVEVERQVLRDLSESVQRALEADLARFGFELADVLGEGPPWHLGYVARQQAAEFAPQLRGAEHPAVLSFAANGSPQISIQVK